MKFPGRIFVIVAVVCFLLFQDISISGTVGSATLSPSRMWIPTGYAQQIYFSATNDKAFSIKTYHAEFSFTPGLNITDFLIVPTATTAKIDSRKNLIILEWSNVAQGTALIASFNVSANAPGTYDIKPSTIYYTDFNRKTYTASCTSSELIISDPIGAPSPPKNIRSMPGEGFINIYWDKSSDTDISGYKVYRSTSASDFIAIGSTIANSPFKDTTVENGKTYYYVVSSVDTSGNESGFSTETAATRLDLLVKTYSSLTGATAVAVGDVNGDGKPDLILGFSNGYSGGRGKNATYGGNVVIFYGGNTTDIPDVTLYAPAVGGFGYSLAVVDMNHDGYDDIVVGAPFYNIDGPTELVNYGGRAYVYAGGPQINPTPAYTITGNHSYGCDSTGCGYYMYIAEQLGYSIAAAGDVDGDGYPDIVIGAPYGGYTMSGRIYVLYGGPGLSALRTNSLSGPHAYQYMGSSVASAGDVNKDGYCDIIAGAPSYDSMYGFDYSNYPYGGAYLFIGGPFGVQQSAAFSTGIQEDGFGITVSSAGDANGDGYSDIAIAAKNGPVSVYYGGSTMPGTADMTYYQATNFLTSLMDLNKDGLDALLLDGPTVYFGNDSGENVADINGTGLTLLGAVDRDGDGLKEMVASDSAGVHIYSLSPYLGLPAITLAYPRDHAYTGFSHITVRGSLTGTVANLKVKGQAVPVQPDGTFSADVVLALGDNTFEVLAETPEGKIGRRIVTVTYAQPAKLTVSITFPADGTTINTTPVTVTGTVSDSSASITVNGVQSTVTGTAFTASGINLQEGANTIIANVRDVYGQTTSSSITLTLLTQGVISGTATDSATGLPLTGVSVTIRDAKSNIVTTTTGSDGTYTASGVTQGSFLATFTKTGYIEQNISSSLAAGQTKMVSVQLVPKPPLAITLTSPQNGSVISAATIAVTGTVNNNASVTINGSGVTVSGGLFSTYINLHEGQNTIIASAIDEYGQTASQSITVTVALPKPPVTTDISMSGITADSATITWTTDQPSDSVIEYGVAATYGSIATDLTMTTSHCLALAGLIPNTTYHFKVTSKNADGLSLSSADNTFITARFKATALGDFGNVTVMEVIGNYDAKNTDGMINSLPRQEIAKEFIRTHPDQYDFLVIMSNFDFAMPTGEAKAFYMEVKNNVQGIGKTVFDNSAAFGSSGKLQGTIDMGNIAGLGVNPLDPAKFETTLDTLAHEQLHRWGAGVRFKNPDGTLNNGLYGKDNAHWSYMLDTDGSLEYGNDWKANGDGTFTSVSAAKYYSNLDLYLMGLIDKSQVPPMTLIESASIDPTLLPSVGTTITGTVRTVSIDDIIAAEGERIPNVSTSQKTFKTGFIFITQPGTLTGNEPSGIETIRSAWAGRFASLTGGKGSIADVASSLTVTITSPSNGAAISRPDVTVKGVIANSTGNETGVTVNGIVAIVSGNQFIAEHVPLGEGANTITVLTTDTIGSTATNTVTINAVSAENYIQVTSNIESGIAPLEAALRVDGSFSITNASINATGPTVPEITEIAPGEYKVKMIAEGTYTFTISATGPDGNGYQDSVTITVQNRAQIDKLLKAKWGGMKTALVGGNAEGAVSYFAERSKESFRQQFNALSQLLPQIAADMGAITMVNVKDNVSEYDLRTVRNGTTYSFQVLFEKDINGFWRIRSF